MTKQKMPIKSEQPQSREEDAKKVLEEERMKRQKAFNEEFAALCKKYNPKVIPTIQFQVP